MYCHCPKVCWPVAALWQLAAIAITTFSPLLFAQPSERLAGPQYLQPVPPYPDEYRQIVFNSLIKEAQPVLWMLVRPSFSPEYAMVITESPNNIVGKPKTYRVRWSIAKEKIWRWKRVPGTNQNRLDLIKRPRLEEKTIEIPASTVDEIQKAWRYVINETRYTDASPGMDGTAYEFYIPYELYGQAWSPTEGPPKRLVDLGMALIDFVRADQPSRQSKLDLCIELAQAIQENRRGPNEKSRARRR